MDSRWVGYGALAVVAVASLALLAQLALSTGAIAPLLGDGYDPDAENADYEHTTVTVRDGETDEELARVEAAIADTFSKRYLGLSATDSLPENRGMLFVHDSTGEYTYVMRDMSFGIDIVFVDADGTITAIHEATEPEPGEDGNTRTYPGEGRYVLEVNRGWTADRGVEVGDEVDFEL